MKKLKRIASLLLVVAACVLLPGVNSLTASADTPNTFYIKFVPSLNEWRYQVSPTWDDNKVSCGIAALEYEIKDGDVAIVEHTDAYPALHIPAHLSNLTIAMDAFCVVSAEAIDSCYILRGGTAAVTGDVKTAYVYDNGVCTFNSNVGTLYVINDPAQQKNLLQGTVTAGGTVDHLIGIDGNALVHYDLYNFQAGKLVVEKGDVKTDKAFYSTTAPANTGTSSSSSADEYDDVPKTGESNVVVWLLAASALCLLGRYSLKKHEA